MRPPAPDPIVAEIERQIARGEAPWFPGLAYQLATAFWRGTPRMRAEEYGSARWLTEAIACPRDELALITTAAGARAILEQLPPSIRQRFSGLRFADGLPMGEVVQSFAHALRWLEPPAGAPEAIASLVRTIHLIASTGPGYDCSHSDPALPFSIFVSVPLGERDEALRLAESILHEAMHLQLSLIERYAPVVGEKKRKGYSPWQRRLRPVSGVVHGLYVFGCILRWLTTLSNSARVKPEDRRYVDRRRVEIAREIEQIAELPTSPALTSFGRELSAWLIIKSKADAGTTSGAVAASRCEPMDVRASRAGTTTRRRAPPGDRSPQR
jgi:hypothetical protein